MLQIGSCFRGDPKGFVISGYNIKKYQDISRYIKIYQEISRYIKICQEISRYIKIYQEISRYIKIYQEFRYFDRFRLFRIICQHNATPNPDRNRVIDHRFTRFGRPFDEVIRRVNESTYSRCPRGRAGLGEDPDLGRGRLLAHRLLLELPVPSPERLKRTTVTLIEFVDLDKKVIKNRDDADVFLDLHQ